VQRASADEWSAAMTEAGGFRTTSFLGASANEIGRGELADGGSWRAQLEASGNVAALETPSRFATHELIPHDAPLHLLSSPNATLVIARVPSGGGFGSLLRVSTVRGTVDIALAPAGAIGTPMVAAHAFSEIGPFSASLLDADGTTLATVSGGTRDDGADPVESIAPAETVATNAHPPDSTAEAVATVVAFFGQVLD
jgi:hypothetical protein